MSVEETKKLPRAALVELNADELEQLLAHEFSEEDGFEPDVEYIMEIMEVMREKEDSDKDEKAEIDAAWRELKEQLNLNNDPAFETVPDERPSSDHVFQTKKRQRHTKPFTHVLRTALVAAALILLLCGTVQASGFDLFRAIANWTAETFSFLIPGQEEPFVEEDPFVELRMAAEPLTDTPCIPKWGPEGTVAISQVEVVRREDRVRIRGTFSISGAEFGIHVTIFTSQPDAYIGDYQKNEGSEAPYVVGKITHYLMQNYDNSSASWQNDCVEVYIQGMLTIEQLKDMIDSIYEE